MELKNILGVIVALIVATALLTSIIIPVVNSSMVTAGDAVSYTNPTGGAYKLSDYSETISFERLSDGTVTVNGEEVTSEHTGFVIASDGIVIYYAFGGRLYFTSQEAALNNLAASSTAHITVEYSNGVSTYTNVDTSASAEAPYTWAYIYTVDGDFNTGYLGSTSYYVKSIKDVTCTGYYSSGENDTGFIFKDGVLQIEEDYESSVTYDLALVEGTTDIYRLSNFKIHIGEEEFAPYVCLVPSTVTGHKDSGATYELLGVLPILVTVGIILGVIGMLYLRRE